MPKNVETHIHTEEYYCNPLPAPTLSRVNNYYNVIHVHIKNNNHVFVIINFFCFYSNGSDFSPAHKYKDFTFTTYSPVAFRFFREAFQIKAEDYLV